MAFYRPEAHRRQAELEPAAAALLFIDVQRYNCSHEGAIYQSLSEEQRSVRGRARQWQGGRAGASCAAQPLATCNSSLPCSSPACHSRARPRGTFTTSAWSNANRCGPASSGHAGAAHRLFVVAFSAAPLASCRHLPLRQRRARCSTRQQHAPSCHQRMASTVFLSPERQGWRCSTPPSSRSRRMGGTGAWITSSVASTCRRARPTPRWARQHTQANGAFSCQVCSGMRRPTFAKQRGAAAWAGRRCKPRCSPHRCSPHLTVLPPRWRRCCRAAPPAPTKSCCPRPVALCSSPPTWTTCCAAWACASWCCAAASPVRTRGGLGRCQLGSALRSGLAPRAAACAACSRPPLSASMRTPLLLQTSASSMRSETHVSGQHRAAGAATMHVAATMPCLHMRMRPERRSQPVPRLLPSPGALQAIWATSAHW